MGKKFLLVCLFCAFVFSACKHGSDIDKIKRIRDFNSLNTLGVGYVSKDGTSVKSKLAKGEEEDYVVSLIGEDNAGNLLQVKFEDDKGNEVEVELYMNCFAELSDDLLYVSYKNGMDYDGVIRARNYEIFSQWDLENHYNLSLLIDKKTGNMYSLNDEFSKMLSDMEKDGYDNPHCGALFVCLNNKMYQVVNIYNEFSGRNNIKILECSFDNNQMNIVDYDDIDLNSYGLIYGADVKICRNDLIFCDEKKSFIYDFLSKGIKEIKEEDGLYWDPFFSELTFKLGDKYFQGDTFFPFWTNNKTRYFGARHYFDSDGSLSNPIEVVEKGVVNRSILDYVLHDCHEVIGFDENYDIVDTITIPEDLLNEFKAGTVFGNRVYVMDDSGVKYLDASDLKDIKRGSVDFSQFNIDYSNLVTKFIKIEDNNLIMTFTGADRKVRRFYVDYYDNVKEIENAGSAHIPFTPMVLEPLN